MKTKTLLPLLLAGLTIPAFADIDRTKKPEPDPAPAASFPDYRTETLPNGLKVFVIHDDRKPTVTFRLIIRSGSIADGSKMGAASFTASLLNRGTEHRDAATFALETDSLGVKVEAASGPDSISVAASGLTKYTDKILDLFSDAVLHPAFADPQFARVQKQTLSSLEAEKQQPSSLAEKLAGKVVYGSFPYGNYLTPEDVTALKRDDLVAFHHAQFLPNNASLAVVGDVKADDILPLIQKAFGSWQKGEVPELKLPELPKIKGLTIHLVDRPGSVQSNIIVLSDAPPRNNPDLPELNVVNATLGGGFSGRLFQNLREKHGWTYGSMSAFDYKKLAGDFEATAETRNEVTGPAVAEILKEIERIRTEPAKEEEIALQRQYNVGNYLLSLENTSRTAQRVQDIDLYGLPADFYKTYAKRMSVVTPAQVEELAKKYLTASDVAIVVVGEAKEIKPELEKVGKVIVYDQELKPVTK
ncbi:peptidase M16 domain protein [Chthoniobacter flavus Ellin428]|uniref:Peptidase M16 domain protein n=1 Tax=Chthoniobacter flavus Ellin428 TaxID=497964 RepID=B4D030_9BACT|nr:pitrilysin family protein [Chthoniobacter flavus]EDY20344.1 peptidase M16 domain protein [Chthoniobacter flavus Ellin428]TCO94237.1 putative Zn-dependent peptidase [Chthoniobacter flavus]